jgi:hypothetical protein
MSAILSPCGTYRYRLERAVALDGPVFAFFGVNPSTADASLDDATVRKWTGFVKRWGGSRFIVGNVFPYRATDITTLRDLNVLAVRRDENDIHLMQIAKAADVLVPCWGDSAKLPKVLRPWLAYTMKNLRATGKPIKAFGFTASGEPKHPLMLGYDTPLVDFPSGVKGGSDGPAL